MSSFSHLSASHNSNNGNPKKHWRAPAWCDSAIWEAARRFAGITHRRIRRRRAPPGSWCCGRAQSPGPRDRSLETSVLGLRKSPSVHCSKPTAPLAYGWCRRKHHVFSASAVPKSLYTGQCPEWGHPLDEALIVRWIGLHFFFSFELSYLKAPRKPRLDVARWPARKPLAVRSFIVQNGGAWP
jgi:hypothetical protein